MLLTIYHRYFATIFCFILYVMIWWRYSELFQDSEARLDASGYERRERGGAAIPILIIFLSSARPMVHLLSLYWNVTQCNTM